MRILSLSVIVLCLFLSSCFLMSHDVVIDNPSNYKLSVFLDEETFILAPKNSIEISVSHGKHQVRVIENSSKIEKFIWKDLAIKSDGILNISGSEYVIEHCIFNNFENTTTKDNKKKSVIINDFTYYGNLELIKADSIFIPKSWDRGLEENISSIDDVNPRNKTLSKIFRVGDFENDFLRNVR
jgi:hypothetical protein